MSDPFTEGYVGISNCWKRRWNDHKNDVRYHSLVHNKIKSLNLTRDNLTLIHEDLTHEFARKLEKVYRPLKKIGWNLAEGGGFPPTTPKKRSPEARRAISEGRKKASTIRKSGGAVNKGWFKKGKDERRISS